MSVIVVDTREDLVSIQVVVRLPDVVEGGVRLLQIPWAELIKESVEDRRSSKADDFGADRRFYVGRVGLG